LNKRQKEVAQHQLDSEKAVLKQLERQYTEALNDINRKIMILQSDELTQSRIYRIEYQKALKKQTEAILEKLHSDEFTTIQQFLSESYTDAFVGAVYDMHGQGVPLIMPIDPAEAVRAIQTESKINEGLYESLGVDTRNLKKSISSEISRGIAGGMTTEEIARNLKNATKAPLSRAKTIVRTESHRIQQASCYNAQQHAKSKGADVVKMWDATMDGDTRPMHRRLDGQIKELDEPFEIGGKKAMYPGDFGDPAEDCNCRCQSLQRARWALDESELKTLKDRAEFFGLDKTKDFEEFKEKYLNTAKTIENPGKSDILNTREMLKKKSDAREGFKFISDERFNNLTIEAVKKGAVILRGTPEIERHLDAMGASASTLGDALLFRSDVCVSEVLEETFHYMQNISGTNDDKGEPLRTLLNEIEAKEYILANANKYKVPRNELDLIEKQLEGYREQLAEYEKDGN
jgi:SPP1 gp7 family putative phage head morphogenesis protein